MRQKQNGHRQDGCGNDSGSGQEPPPPPSRKRVPEELAAHVRRIAYHALPPRARTTTNLYLDPWVVNQGAALGPSFESLRVRRDSVLVFADYEIPADALVEVKPVSGVVQAHVVYQREVNMLPFGLYKYPYDFDYTAKPVGYLLK